MTPDLPRTEFDGLLLALKTLIETDPFFPPVELDAPEPVNMRTGIAGAPSSVRDHVTVQSEEPSEVTRDGGAELSWELEARLSVVYAVQGGALSERRGRRDAAIRHLEALIEANRTLGIADPQIYAELQPAERADELVVKGAAGFSLVLVPIHVQYVARSAAG